MFFRNPENSGRWARCAATRMRWELQRRVANVKWALHSQKLPHAPVLKEKIQVKQTCSHACLDIPSNCTLRAIYCTAVQAGHQAVFQTDTRAGLTILLIVVRRSYRSFFAISELRLPLVYFSSIACIILLLMPHKHHLLRKVRIIRKSTRCRLSLSVQFSSDKAQALNYYNASSSYNAWNQDRTILVVGDGDLSYSASMARSMQGTKLVATVLESELEHRTTYINSSQNIDHIRRLGHQVLFQVDATCLSQRFDSRSMLFDQIQWNFPHSKGRTNARRNRELIQKFFVSSKEVLKPNGGQIHMALFDHQGGAYCKNLEEWRQSWMPARYAAETAGLLLTHVYHYEVWFFSLSLMIGYRSFKNPEHFTFRSV